nr:HNH endonuclease signature motif containing protein [uncultured Roseibium sp.]
MMHNRHGLGRKISKKIQRTVRKRCKFGCVICRAAVFHYEHITPEFKDAHKHDADNICCLCGSCHEKVNRKQFSKKFVLQEYQRIQKSRDDEVQAPFDFLDFSNGKAELKIGGIAYDPGVRCIFKYHGRPVLSAAPGDSDVPGAINATFLDCEGRQTLRIKNNVWEGAIDAWDTEVTGSRISVRKRKGQFSLRLRLEAPGRIVVERLDMRFNDAIILASEHTHALGRQLATGQICWFHATMVHMGAPLRKASAIEFVHPGEIERRDLKLVGSGKRLASENNLVVAQTGLGVTYKPIGVIVGAGCANFGLAEFAVGASASLEEMRKCVFERPNSVAEFIATE